MCGIFGYLGATIPNEACEAALAKDTPEAAALLAQTVRDVCYLPYTETMLA